MIVEADFPDHWKTRTLIALAGDEVAVRCLIRFWAHCQQRRRWTFDTMTPDRLAAICNWPHDKKKWWDAMLATFIDQKHEGIEAHGWGETNASLTGRWKGGKVTQKKWRATAKQDSSDKAKPGLGLGEERRGEEIGLEERREEKRDPLKSPEGGQASEPDAIADYAEAKRLIATLIFGDEKKAGRPWSHEAEHALSRLLPLPLGEIKLVAWFHGLESDDAVHELKVRRQSEGTLLANWSDEVTRAGAFRKKRGLGSGRLDAAAPVKKEPAAWREFFRWYHDNAEIVLPDSFWKLTAQQRADYDRDFVKFSQEREAVA